MTTFSRVHGRMVAAAVVDCAAAGDAQASASSRRRISADATTTRFGMC
jgi:hypothetical protein